MSKCTKPSTKCVQAVTALLTQFHLPNAKTVEKHWGNNIDAYRFKWDYTTGT